MKKNMWNVKTPFFRPVWRRLLACCIVGLWGIVELIYGNKTFGILFLGAGAYLVHQFFIIFKVEDYQPPSSDS